MHCIVFKLGQCILAWNTDLLRHKIIYFETLSAYTKVTIVLKMWERHEKDVIGSLALKVF